uniref:Uncharacterized protein n=1 Tax=Arundo donax TaxID=35708 RepID=A0A0A9FLP0_ARUDO
MVILPRSPWDNLFSGLIYELSESAIKLNPAGVSSIYQKLFVIPSVQAKESNSKKLRSQRMKKFRNLLEYFGIANSDSFRNFVISYINVIVLHWAYGDDTCFGEFTTKDSNFLSILKPT